MYKKILIIWIIAFAMINHMYVDNRKTKRVKSLAIKSLNDFLRSLGLWQAVWREMKSFMT